MDEKNKWFRESLIDVENKVESMDFDAEKISDKVSKLVTEKNTIKDDLVYLQSQSMRNNLIFWQYSGGQDRGVRKVRVGVEAIFAGQNEIGFGFS